MYYFIYVTKNKINGRYYIGAHTTRKIDDEYLGSGVALTRAIKKYGKDNFVREIIHFCDSKEEMYIFEEKFVDHSDPASYNMRRGGKGGWYHVDTSGDKSAMKRPEVVAKVVAACRKNGSYHTEERKRHQQIMTLKAAEKNRGKKRPDHTEFMKEWSKKHWKENKERLRDCLSSTFKVVSPEGIVYTTNRLQDFCKEHNLTYTTIWNTSRTNKVIKKGKSKGWTCIKISQH